jgi:hypothetical protein
MKGKGILSKRFAKGAVTNSIDLFYSFSEKKFSASANVQSVTAGASKRRAQLEIKSGRT